MSQKTLEFKDIVSIIENMGGFNVSHSGRTLGDHLLNTLDILQMANCPYEVYVAGGLHSIYGTNVFKNGVMDYSHREQVQNVVGHKVENLIYLFSIINRPHGLETGHTINYRTGEKITLTEKELLHLRLIEAANLIEQRCSILRFPNILDAWEGYKNYSNPEC